MKSPLWMTLWYRFWSIGNILPYNVSAVCRQDAERQRRAAEGGGTWDAEFVQAYEGERRRRERVYEARSRGGAGAAPSADPFAVRGCRGCRALGILRLKGVGLQYRRRRRIPRGPHRGAPPCRSAHIYPHGLYGF
jgi:hypothetical protein